MVLQEAVDDPCQDQQVALQIVELRLVERLVDQNQQHGLLLQIAHHKDLLMVVIRSRVVATTLKTNQLTEALIEVLINQLQKSCQFP